MQKNQNHAEMTEFEGTQAIVNQGAVQAATAVMTVLRDADVGCQPATITILRKPQKQRHRIVL